MKKIPPFLLLDAWRGIAALWVVMTHACVAFLSTGDNLRFLHFPLYAFSVWGQLGVVMFFVISGYCIMGAAYGALAARRTVGRYALDRIRRIYPPYLLACALSVGLGLLIVVAQSHRLLPPSNNPVDLSHPPLYWLANLLLLQSELNQPTLLLVAWSLCYEIVFYAMLGALLLAARIFEDKSAGKGVAIFQIGISGLTIGSLAWLLVSPHSCPFPLDRWYQFGLGSLLFLVSAAPTAPTAWSARAQLALATALVLLLSLLAHHGQDILGQPGVRYQAAMCAAFVLCLWALRPFDARLVHLHLLRPLLWLGTISYSIYLVHPLVMPFPDVAGRHAGFNGEKYWVTYLVEIAISILAGWLFFLAVERHFISSRQKQRVKEELGESGESPGLSRPPIAEGIEIP